MTAEQNRARIAVDAAVADRMGDKIQWFQMGFKRLTCDHPAHRKIMRKKTGQRGYDFMQCLDCQLEDARKRRGSEKAYI